MRKFLVLGLVVVMGVAIAGLTGCGGNTSQAQKQMKVADASYAAVNKDMNSLQASLTAVLGGAISDNFTALTPQVLAGASATIDKILTQLPKVRAQYEQMTTLSGVEDYVSYAKAMIKAVDADIAAIKAGKSMIDALTPLVQSGNTAAITQYFQANTQQINALQALSAASTKAYEDAQAIKTSKNLK